jgi:hypothetical protein
MPVAVAVLGVLLLGAAPDGAPSGAVYVTTLPAGADVWIDGTYVGHAPVFVDSLAAGHHAISLTRSGWTAREVDIDVAVGSTTMSSVRLLQASRSSVRAAGAVTFHDVPEGSRVELDGIAVDHPTRGGLPLAAGTHVVVVVTHQGRSTHTFTVFPETTTQVVFGSQSATEVKSAVVAPAEEYLPIDSFRVDGKKVTVHYASHDIVARLGELPMRYDGVTVSYDAAPSLIGGRLYLPLALLARLTEAANK